ncbi:hypothetical protein NC651_033660 [Populus alba x Populus x berolinensis]|nr:hypothetical protein NC651_033660 [Populus alba x Populus x berolinensis]
MLAVIFSLREKNGIFNHVLRSKSRPEKRLTLRDFQKRTRLRSHPLWDSSAYDDAHFLTRYIGFTSYSSIFPFKMDKRKDIPSSKDWGRGNLRSQTLTTPVRWHVLRPFQIMLKACFFFNLHALRRLQENSARSMGWTELPYNLSSKHMERNLDKYKLY